MSYDKANKKLFLLTFAALWLNSCKFGSKSNISEENSGTNDTVTIAIKRQVHPVLETLFQALSANKPLTLKQLDEAGVALNSGLSSAVKYSIPPKGPESRVRQAQVGRPNFNPDTYKDVYRGLRLGSRVFVFKQAKQPIFSKLDRWTAFTWFGGDLLRDEVNNKWTSIEDQMRHVLDAKIYEPISLKKQQDLVNTVDFAAHFIPGYAGAERLIYTGKSSGEKVLGAVELVGDLATLGLGSKIRVVQKTAAVITISAATVRVGAVGYKAATGRADWTDGADAFLATVEAGLAAVTLVKLKLTSAKAVVSSLDEAELLSKQLGRSADDILQNGLSRKELESLVGDIPSLRKLDDLDEAKSTTRAENADDIAPNKIDDAADDLTPSKSKAGNAADDVASVTINPCRALSLLADDLCDIARLAPSERKGMRKAVESRSDAFGTAKREAGGYFGPMEEITPKVSDKAANGNIGYRELRGQVADDGSPIYTREYWFKNSDGQVVVLQEHSLGHPGLTNGELAHFNVRHVPEPNGDVAEIIKALDKGAPPPNVPAVGHYDFRAVN